MASAIDWGALLDARCPSYKVEVEAFLDSVEVSSSNEISMIIVHEAIKDNLEISENLRLLYEEAVNGQDKNVRLRIKNRMANFRRALR